MKENKRSAVKDIAIGLVALIAVLTIALLFIFAVITIIGRLESEIVAAITAASATIIASVLAIIVSKRYEQKVRIAQEIREQKTPVYEELISVFFRNMFADKLGQKKISDRDIMRTFADVTPKLIIWGSEDVIQAWTAIRYHDWSAAQSADSLRLWNSLLLAVRKDIGNSVDQLKPFDLLRLFVNDIGDQGIVVKKNRLPEEV